VTPIDPLTERSSTGWNDPSERSERSPGAHEPHRAASAGFAMSAASKGPGRGRAADQPAHCGICRSELEDESFHRHEGREELGSYCSPVCLSAAEALVSLQLWSMKLDASGHRAEAQSRTALADELLLLWRRRIGPDPNRVSAAVDLARSREESR
jgi:hypothetical protein